MVGRKKDEMAPVSVAVTSVGQVTIPKAFRDALGWGDRVLVEKKGNTVVLKKEKSYREKLEEIRKDMEGPVFKIALWATKKFKLWK